MARPISRINMTALDEMRKSKKPLKVKDLTRLLRKRGIIFKAITHIYTYLHRLQEKGYIIIRGRKRRLKTFITVFGRFLFNSRSSMRILSDFMSLADNNFYKPEFQQLEPLQDDDPLFVSYDIPEWKRDLRIAFSTILLENGFLKLHRSMYYGEPAMKNWVLKVAEELGVKDFIAVGRFVFEYVPKVN